MTIVGDLSVIEKRHLLRYRVLLFLTAWFVFCPPASGDWAPTLKEIYETPIPAQIRRNFNQVVETRNTCPDCVLGVFDGEKFMDVYPRKFIVLSLTPNSFGGVWAFIAVQGERKDTYRLWLYDIDDNEYDLRSIEELPSSMDEEFVGDLEKPAHRPYWI